MGKRNLACRLLVFFSIFFIVYFYYLRWKTDTLYGDDYFQYQHLSSVHSFKDVIGVLLDAQKFRPINSLAAKIIVSVFGKHSEWYYVFNVFIQALNTYFLALLINFFLRLLPLSIILSLVYGLSRFAFYGISELINGGPLEGLALTFFMLCLLYIFKPFVSCDGDNKEKYKLVLLSLVFANLCMYTHERYVVLVPFVALVAVAFPKSGFSARQKKRVVAFSLLSIIANIFIKTVVYQIPFFVGTGGTNISFSFSRALSFLIEGLLSIIQINSGPEYLIGTSFNSLDEHKQSKVAILIASLAILLFVYIIIVFVKKKDVVKRNFFIFLFLGVAFGLCLVPAIVTIRLEQRWLQASLAIFVVMISVMIECFRFNNVIKFMMVGSLAMLFIRVNHYYLDKIADNIYLKNAERIAYAFRWGMDEKVIRPKSSELLIWSKKNDKNRNNEIWWAIGGGYLFEFYSTKGKEIEFVDENSNRHIDSLLSISAKDAIQIIYFKDQIVDITDWYLRDSLETFNY